MKQMMVGTSGEDGMLLHYVLLGGTIVCGIAKN